MTELSRALKADPAGILRILREDPRVFDSLWYSAFPPRAQDGAVCDIDAIMRGER